MTRTETADDKKEDNRDNTTWLQWAASHVFTITLGILTPILGMLPPVLWSAFAWALTPVVWLALKRRRKQAIYNLQTVLGMNVPEATAMGRASFHSNLLVLFESLALWRLLQQKGVTVETRITPQATAIIDRVKRGEVKMALALSSHSGVFEFIGAYLASLVYPTPTVVAAKLPRSVAISTFLRRARSRYGLTLINKNSILRYLLKQRTTDSPALNIFLCDQHFNRSGAIKAPFLGKTACTVGIPATIIQKYRPPTLIGHCIRRKAGDYLIEIEAFDVEQFNDLSGEKGRIAITTKINETLSTYISSAPEQWTWGHRRWRDCCAKD